MCLKPIATLLIPLRYGVVMVLRFLTMTGVALGACVTLASPALADPDPAPAPPIPNVNAYMPVNPADYTTNKGRWFAFAGPAGAASSTSMTAREQAIGLTGCTPR